jgi:hypothetical protein
MNERIQELAEQARQYAWVNETHWSAGPERERLFEQKFAELIVAECCSFNYDFLESYREACEVNDKIRKHFGVEE